MISLTYAQRTVDQACRGEIRTRQVFHNGIDIHFRSFHQRDGRIDDLNQVVRRDIGGHTHGDTCGAINKQSGYTGRQNQWFVLLPVVVRSKIYSFLVQVSQQFMCQLRHTDFCVTHGRRGITIDRTKVTLSIHQHVAHRERLCHANDGVIDGRITMRMVLTNDITHYAGRFFVSLIPVITQHTHRVEYASVHGFQAVADVR